MFLIDLSFRGPLTDYHFMPKFFTLFIAALTFCHISILVFECPNSLVLQAMLSEVRLMKKKSLTPKVKKTFSLQKFFTVFLSCV